MRKAYFLCLLLGCMLTTIYAASDAQKTSPMRPVGSTARVTAHLKSMPLREALKELNRLTGVPLEVAPEAADLRVTMFVRDLSLDVVRARLAEIFFLTWKSSKATQGHPASYLLCRSAQNAEQERKLRAHGEDAFRKGIDAALGVLSLPQPERDRLFKTNQALANTFGREGGEAAVKLLSYLTPQQRTSIMDGNKLEFLSDRPPPELAPHLDKLRQALLAGLHSPVFEHKTDQQCVIERIGEGAESRLWVTWSARSEGGGSTGASFTIQGARPEETYPEAYARDHTGADYAETGLTVFLTEKLTAASLDALLEKAAGVLHINMIGESYWEAISRDFRNEEVYPRSVRAGELSTEQVLNGIFMQDYWWKKGAVYLFQRPLWWVARRADVTDAAQAYLTRILKRQPLSLEDGAEVCKTLNFEQMHWLVPRYLRDFQHLQSLWSLLRFYGYLTSSQQAELFQENGLEASSLKPADQQRLRAWIAEQRARALSGGQGAPGEMRIMATCLNRNGKNGLMLFRAVLLAKDGTMTDLCEQYVPGHDPGDVRSSSGAQR